MHTLTARFAAFLALALAACGGSSAHALTDELISNIETLNATLDTIKDEASAKAAVPKLTTLATKMKELQEKMSKLEPTAAEQAELEKQHTGRMTELMQKMQANMMRVGMDEKLSAVLQPVFEKLRQ